MAPWSPGRHARPAPSGGWPLVVRRPRLRLTPVRRAALALVLAALAGVVAARSVGRAEQLRAAYGTTRAVPVAARDLAPGQVVAVDDLRWEDRPTGLLPDDPAPDPVGRTLLQPVAAGEVVLRRRLLDGAGGPLALVPPGGRALAVPVAATAPSLRVGDRVDVLAADAGAVASGARRVAREATVVAVADDRVTVAVTASEAPAVARASLDGLVALALVAPGGPEG